MSLLSSLARLLGQTEEQPGLNVVQASQPQMQENPSLQGSRNLGITGNPQNLRGGIQGVQPQANPEMLNRYNTLLNINNLAGIYRKEQIQKRYKRFDIPGEIHGALPPEYVSDSRTGKQVRYSDQVREQERGL